MSTNMERYPIQILDVYSGNRWSAAQEKAKGTRGVIIKAGQGGWPDFPKNFVADCEVNEMPWGVYWLVDARYSSDYHMLAIKRTFLDRNFGALGMWFDCETPYQMSPSLYWKMPYAGTTLIEQVTDRFTGWSGSTGGIYTSPGFASMLGWNSVLWKMKAVSYKLAKLPLWVAQYNNFITKPDLFGRWTDWLLWQYTPDPDYSFFNGNENDYQNFMDGNYKPIIPVNPVIRAEVIAPRGVNVRLGPGTIYSTSGAALPVHTMMEGGQVTIVSTSEQWLNIDVPRDGWVALKYNGENLCQLQSPTSSG